MDAGYRLTQVADVASQLKVSPGGIYRYVDGKETLFHIAALHAARVLEDVGSLPLKTTPSETAEILRDVIRQNARWPLLRRAIRETDGSSASAAAIGAELYDLLFTWGSLIVLMERCARDRPDISVLFETEMRSRYMSDLNAWSRRLKRVADGAAPAALARGAMEAVSWLALRRPRDTTGRLLPDREARLAAIEIFIGAFKRRLTAH